MASCEEGETLKGSEIDCFEYKGIAFEMEVKPFVIISGTSLDAT
jgi:hypothetical protein